MAAKRTEAEKKAGHILPTEHHYALVACIVLSAQAQGRDVTGIPAYSECQERGLL